MTQERQSRDPTHFERIYAANADPWQYHTSQYEHEKYRRTLAALAGRRFRLGLEVGCSIGVLTRLLAAHCDAVLAIDFVAQPLAAARTTCADQPWVRFAQMRVPGEWPRERFDLIVLSEVLYFLSPRDIAAVAAHTCDTLEADGIALVVNWRGRSDDPCTGDQAAELFIGHSQTCLLPIEHYHDDNYRLDTFRRSGA